jgi:hypothetical protein
MIHRIHHRRQMPMNLKVNINSVRKASTDIEAAAKMLKVYSEEVNGFELNSFSGTHLSALNNLLKSNGDALFDISNKVSSTGIKLNEILELYLNNLLYIENILIQLIMNMNLIVSFYYSFIFI